MFNRCCIIVLICGALGSSACQVTWDVLDGYVLECDANTPCPTGGVCTDDGFCQIDDDPICGNGVIETGEICDEGEANEDGYHHAKTCLSDCSNYGGYCGDGIENGGEQCDDGGDNSDINPDACRVNCTSPRCGDAVVDTSLGEICDDGLDGNTDAYGEPGRCGTDCVSVAPYCGDGISNGGEQCDAGSDSSDINPDACRTNCMSPSCGDWVIDAGEVCDDGQDNTESYSAQVRVCNTTCNGYAPRCGDGQRQDGVETCDDGENNTDTYQAIVLCNTSCSGFAPRCGDGNTTHGEQCDSGPQNTDEHSESVVCNNSCTGLAPRCGDGVVDSEFDEVCDNGQANSSAHSLGATCKDDCSGLAPYCGDNIKNGDEACDDGNTTDDGNGCSTDCKRLGYCGDDEVQYYFEGCDDGDSNIDTCAYGLESCVVCVPPGYEDSSNDAYDTPAGCQYREVTGGFCGDGVMQRQVAWGGAESSPWEACDGSLACSELGLGIGQAVCDTDCTAYDTSACSDTSMVYVPSGPFMMGCNAAIDFSCAADELPAHEVWLDAFWIDRMEVTAGDYKLCVDAGVCSYSGGTFSGHTYDNGMDDYPMNLVKWSQALQYCTWREKRLPTEAEWEKAARGVGGDIYPWGNDEPNCELAWSDLCPGDSPLPVGSLESGASPYGALNMAGNMYEWVSDYYASDYYQDPPAGGWVNPQGPEDELYRVTRGGSYNWWASHLRASERSKRNLNAYLASIGFRCAFSQTGED